MKKESYAYTDVKNSILFFLQEDCVRQFGAELGEKIYKTTTENFESLACDAEKSGESKKKLKMISTHFYPVYAYYQALLKHGYNTEDALNFVRNEVLRAANAKKPIESKYIKKRDPYKAFCNSAKAYMKKKFPSEFWTAEIVEININEVHLNVSACIYKELCDKYNCPELCPIYCERYDAAYSYLGDNLRFYRRGTLGKGNDCCDFRFRISPRS